MSEDYLSLGEFQKMHNEFNHECSRIINALTTKDSRIKALEAENAKLKKFKEDTPAKKLKFFTEFKKAVLDNLMNGKGMFEGLE